MAGDTPFVVYGALALGCILLLSLFVEVGQRSRAGWHRPTAGLGVVGDPCSPCRDCSAGLECLALWPAGLEPKVVWPPGGEPPAAGGGGPGCCARPEGALRFDHCRASPWAFKTDQPCHIGAAPDACAPDGVCRPDAAGHGKCVAA